LGVIGTVESLQLRTRTNQDALRSLEGSLNIGWNKQKTQLLA
jgi:hypothetical protein